jgi:hypothetical protein
MLAEAGCSAHMIQAITGHKHLAEVETYTKAASQRRLADLAMQHLSNRTEWLDKLAKNVFESNGLAGGYKNPPSAPPRKPPQSRLNGRRSRFSDRRR